MVLVPVSDCHRHVDRGGLPLDTHGWLISLKSICSRTDTAVTEATLHTSWSGSGGATQSARSLTVTATVEAIEGLLRSALACSIVSVCYCCCY